MGVKFFGVIVTLMVTTVIIIGLIITGSPLKERERRFDEQRTSNLQEISAAVDHFYSRTGHLPTTLNELTKPDVARLYYIRSLTDPESSTPYEYSITGKSTYKLCATFTHANNEKSSENKLQIQRFSYPDQKVWEHPAGKKCFDLLSPPPKPEGKK
jgi:hypothetical protein